MSEKESTVSKQTEDRLMLFLFDWAIEIWVRWSQDTHNRENWQAACEVLLLILKYPLADIDDILINKALERAQTRLYYVNVAKVMLEKEHSKVSKVPYRAFKYVLYECLKYLYGENWNSTSKKD